MENATEDKVDMQLKRIVENIESSERDKQELSRQISEIYKEAKAAGFDPKIIRKLVSMRKKDQDERQEEEYLLETYKEALGMK